MKRFASLLCLYFLFASTQKISAQAGSGTSGNPYQITTCDELQKMEGKLNAYWILMNDIDCIATKNGSGQWTGTGFRSVGNATNPFTGSFNGKGFTVKNLYINVPVKDSVGLFGFTNKAQLYNVKMDSVDITGRNYTGAIAGVKQSTCFDGCSVVGGTVTGNDYTGGAVGKSTNYQGTIACITNSFTKVAVSGHDYTGGLVGYANCYQGGSPDVTNCYAWRNVTGNNRVGGLVGDYGPYQGGGATMTNCYAKGKVIGKDKVGGLVGNSGPYQGGGSYLIRSYATGDVMGTTNVGGLTGNNGPYQGGAGEVRYSYATGNVSGTSNIGGLIGFNGPTSGGGAYVYYSFARGNVNGSSTVGGFVGLHPCNSIIDTCYATGIVTGTTSVGGFAGSQSGVCQGFASCYWNATLNPSLQDVGTGTNSPDVSNISTAAMQTQATYTGWDFVKTWTITANDYPGFYTKTVTTNCTCSPSSPVLITSFNTSICAGGSATLNAGGCTSYVWSPSTGLSATIGASVIASPTVTTTYKVAGTSGATTYTTTIIVSISGVLNLSISSPVTICGSGSVNLSTGGATDYTWSPASGLNTTTGNAVTASPTASTTYVVNGTNGTCSGSASVLVTVISSLTVSVSPPVTVCSGNSVTLTVSGATDYMWSPSTGLNTTTGNLVIANPTSITNYTVTGSTAGCSGTAYTIVSFSSLITTTMSATATTCGQTNGTAQVAASGGTSPYNYQWNISATVSQISNLISQIYSVTVTDAGGCTKTDNVLVTSNPGANIILLSSFSVTCNGGNNGSISLSASGGTAPYFFLWSNGQTQSTINNLQSAIYSATVTDNTGCSSSSAFTISQPSLLSVLLTSTDASCNTGSAGTAGVSASGGTPAYFYLWSTGATVSQISNLISQIYSVTITDSNGCTANDAVTVNAIGTMTATASADTSVCSGSPVTLIAGGGSNYLWNNGATNSSITVSPNVKTVYTVTVFIGTCFDVAMVTVSITAAPAAYAGTGITIIKGNSTTLNGSGGGSYSWSPAQGLSCTTCANPTASPTATTTYYLSTDINGCTDTDSVIVTVETSCGDVFVPSAFSPNNDGQNDVLFVKAVCLTDIKFTVFSLWGEKVFETTDLTKGWDGVYHGKIMDAAVFAYIFEANNNKGEAINQKGNISLLK